MKPQQTQNNQCGPEEERKGRTGTIAMPISKHDTKI